MTTFKYLFVAMMIFVLPAYSYASALANVHTSYLKGDVQLRPEGLTEWVPASINMPLRKGDRLWVPEAGKLEIQLIDGSFLRLNENSSLAIYETDTHSSHFYLTEGQAYVYFRGTRNRMITIDTPVTTATAYDRTHFMIHVPDYTRSEVSVLKGVIHAEDRYGRKRVHAGKTLSINEYGYADLSPLGPPDAWERWNRDRDAWSEDRMYSTRYLPEELHVYAHDFDTNGRWSYVSDYGYVWTPTVSVSIGWSPYRHGRWTWVGGDYVWVSYEPWGWVPYHYGRWAFTASFGWYWVPPVRGKVYWGPGYVGWVHTPSYVAWVPLAPREIYYGYGHYGPHSVNIININVRRPFRKHVYKNVYIDNSVIVVHKDTFVRGKPLRYRSKRNPFLHEKISIGRPKIQPVRRSYMPVVRTIPGSKLPPKRIRDVDITVFNKKRSYTIQRDEIIKTHSPTVKQRHAYRDTTVRNTDKKSYRDSDLRNDMRTIEKQRKPRQRQEEREFVSRDRDKKETRRKLITPRYRYDRDKEKSRPIEKRRKEAYTSERKDPRFKRLDNNYTLSKAAKPRHTKADNTQRTLKTERRRQREQVAAKQKTEYKAAQKKTKRPVIAPHSSGEGKNYAEQYRPARSFEKQNSHYSGKHEKKSAEESSFKRGNSRHSGMKRSGAFDQFEQFSRRQVK